MTTTATARIPNWTTVPAAVRRYPWLSPAQLRLMVHRGELPCCRPTGGRKLLIDEDALAARFQPTNPGDRPGERQ